MSRPPLCVVCKKKRTPARGPMKGARACSMRCGFILEMREEDERMQKIRDYVKENLALAKGKAK